MNVNYIFIAFCKFSLTMIYTVRYSFFFFSFLILLEYVLEISTLSL